MRDNSPRDSSADIVMRFSPSSDHSQPIGSRLNAPFWPLIRSDMAVGHWSYKELELAGRTTKIRLSIQLYLICYLTVYGGAVTSTLWQRALRIGRRWQLPCIGDGDRTGPLASFSAQSPDFICMFVNHISWKLQRTGELGPNCSPVCHWHCRSQLRYRILQKLGQRHHPILQMIMVVVVR